jgi:hypothetical protein
MPNDPLPRHADFVEGGWLECPKPGHSFGYRGRGFPGSQLPRSLAPHR